MASSQPLRKKPHPDNSREEKATEEAEDNSDISSDDSSSDGPVQCENYTVSTPKPINPPLYWSWLSAGNGHSKFSIGNFEEDVTSESGYRKKLPFVSLFYYSICS